MPELATIDRRTSADLVFDHLYGEILSLELMPGARISEAEIAARFSLSRQPVRDAFSRLGAMGLLVIQPQRATQVQRFSREAIAEARFVRLALELELARQAAACWPQEADARMARNLAEQDAAVGRCDTRAFHALDEAFHSLIAEAAGHPEAGALVLQKKAMVDRLCVLSLKEQHEMAELVADHRALHGALRRGDGARAETRLRSHLARIGKTIEAVYRAHPDYFDG